MKGVLLAGGTGSRLFPLTKVTNKHLLPIYNKPMIYYPLETLKQAGITEILIISGRDHCGDIQELLGSGKDMGVKLSYEIQEEAGGIAQALGLAEHFVGNDTMMVILGDNIYQHPIEAKSFSQGAKIFLQETHEANRFGVASLDENGMVTKVVEKPNEPETNYAVTGCYLYDSHVFNIIKTLKPSHRGELEITDVNNAYIAKGEMQSSIINGYWTDAGTFDSLFKASELARKYNQN